MTALPNTDTLEVTTNSAVVAERIAALVPHATVYADYRGRIHIDFTVGIDRLNAETQADADAERTFGWAFD